MKVKVKPFKAENPMKAGSAIGEFLAAIGVTATTKTISKIHKMNNSHVCPVKIAEILSANTVKVIKATTALTAIPIPTNA